MNSTPQKRFALPAQKELRNRLPELQCHLLGRPKPIHNLNCFAHRLNMAHISIRLAMFLLLLCFSAQCLAAPKVLSLRPIDLNGVVDDADISPDGKYIAAAVRACGTARPRRAFTHSVEVWTSADAKLVANRTLLADVGGDVLVALGFSADGLRLVLSDGQGKLRVWQTGLAENTFIDLGFLSEEARELQAKDDEEYARFLEGTRLERRAQPAPRVEQIETSTSSPLVAAVVSIGHGAGLVRVFDFTSGGVRDPIAISALGDAQW